VNNINIYFPIWKYFWHVQTCFIHIFSLFKIYYSEKFQSLESIKNSIETKWGQCLRPHYALVHVLIQFGHHFQIWHKENRPCSTSTRIIINGLHLVQSIKKHLVFSQIIFLFVNPFINVWGVHHKFSHTSK
jgi:hypothetical protein